jgi:hypothetical protein
VPGVLPHVWAWMRDFLASGALEAALTRVTKAVPVPAVAPFDAQSFSGADELRTIRRVLEVYNRGNGLNVIALSAVRMDLHRRAHAALAIEDLPVAADAVPIPRLLKSGELAPETADLVRMVAAKHGDLDGVIPSLYLHLANWPEFLAAACERIMPRLQDGSIARARDEAVALARAEAAIMVAPMKDVARVEGFSAPVLAVLDQFTSRVIPEMLPIGLVLDRALPRAG